MNFVAKKYLVGHCLAIFTTLFLLVTSLNLPVRAEAVPTENSGISPLSAMLPLGQKLIVTSTDDTLASDGVCTLREAIQAANTDAPVGGCGAGNQDDVIDLMTISGTINLRTPLPTITESVNLIGAGSTDLMIQRAANAPEFRLLTIDGVTVTLSGIGLRGGRDASGAGAQTTLVSNILGSISGVNCVGAMISQGYNLDSDTSCGLTQATDKPATDPGLVALADNGGLTPAFALLPSSAALNAGSPTLCSSDPLDQRGVFRPQGAACDIGALEQLPYSTATQLRGRVLDAEDAANSVETPLVGATIRRLDTGLFYRTGEDGFFTLASVADGEIQVEYDAATAYPYDLYGAYRSEVVLTENVQTEITRPIYIMKIDLDSAVKIDPNATTNIVNDNIDVSASIPPNTIKNEDGTNFTGVLTISEVPSAFTPGSLPDTLEPGLVITVQPMGLTFVNPAGIRYPNFDNLPPNSETDLWSMDHAISQFFIAGRGRVTADGLWVQTIEGGIRE